MLNPIDMDITMEQFAAFLDGNLTEEDMQSVSAAIDGDERLTSVLHSAMDCDDTLESYTSEDMQLPEALLDPDFDLPVITTVVDDEVLLTAAPSDDDPVELHSATNPMPVVCEIGGEDDPGHEVSETSPLPDDDPVLLDDNDDTPMDVEPM